MLRKNFGYDKKEFWLKKYLFNIFVANFHLHFSCFFWLFVENGFVFSFILQKIWFLHDLKTKKSHVMTMSIRKSV